MDACRRHSTFFAVVAFRSSRVPCTLLSRIEVISYRWEHFLLRSYLAGAYPRQDYFEVHGVLTDETICSHKLKNAQEGFCVAVIILRRAMALANLHDRRGVSFQC